ncbi:membrane transport protein [Candidatus Blochmanniella vafra str. BVAF]|uniref:Membrane transport protein n=1 Tax=Blochmanniella vafra (strain BVAF) TaxID=859654 RepID=E8Q623_BLOVB|nr:MFS transporter [Candidatus Blochmannia vafer]ADV33639.1 membrane transport protein [Candidatus Blochmannia vafer str. BVAF]
MLHNIQITSTELRLTCILSMIFALRMSGIFMVLPILPIYAISLNGSYEYLVGISIGIYGIMQIIFQLPFGLMSDQIGRKPMIIIGLIIAAVGSEIAAITNEIWGLIIGRALQGIGAIGSVIITLLLESIQEHNRTQAMAILGISFGITFTGSIIIGPCIANTIGLHGLFQIITLITGFTIILAFCLIPKKDSSSNNLDHNINLRDILNNIKIILTNSELLKLNFHIFSLHTVLILNFVIWPKIMTALGCIPNTYHRTYAIIILISILILLPYLFYMHTRINKSKILTISIHILALSEFIMLIAIKSLWLLLVGILLFFIAFNLIESILPDLISKKSPSKYQGTSISIYSIGQFLGVGLGGVTGGLLLEVYGIQSILFTTFIITLLNIIIHYKL